MRQYNAVSRCSRIDIRGCPLSFRTSDPSRIVIGDTGRFRVIGRGLAKEMVKPSLGVVDFTGGLWERSLG